MKHILVVDDDDSVLDSVRNFLQYVGYEVTTACSGQEGIALIDSAFEYDLVITDIRMPGVNGNELAKYIRGSDWAHIPIVGITGFHDDVEQDFFDFVLQKPFDLKTLVKATKMLIDKNENSRISDKTYEHIGSSTYSMT